MRHPGWSILLIAIANIAGCAIAADGDGAPAKRLPTVEAVDTKILSGAVVDAPPLILPVAPGSGVSHEQAMAIARAYFLTHVGCGGLSGVTELADSWKVEGQFGYAGTPIEGFLINKATGALTLPPFWVQ